MELKDRIKTLRKELNLNQDEFSRKLGVARNTIANYETGNRTPMDSTLKSICREYNVNETWLRTGDGKMFVEFPPEDEYFKAATELSMQNDKLAMQAVIEYWKLDDQSKELFRNFLRNVIKNSED